MRKGILLLYLLPINLRTVALKFLRHVPSVETLKLTIGYQTFRVNTQGSEEKAQ